MAEYLKRDGAEIWIDYARIEGGDKLSKRIGDAIKWCDAMVMIWSKHAAVSFWVEEEWNTALTLRRRIIPCILDDAEIPVILLNWFYINFRKFNVGYSGLYRTLKLAQVIGKSVQLATDEKNVNNQTTEETKIFKPVFRFQPVSLSDADVTSIIKKFDFFDENRNKTGKRFNNEYKDQNVNGDKIVFDNASGLIWQKSGSDQSLTFEAAEDYIKELNKKKYANFKNWRLPTLEEAVSLMTPTEKFKYWYIDPVFDKKQWLIWTSDLIKAGLEAAWFVDFYDGFCDCRSFYGSGCYVRAVRSGRSSAGAL